MFGRIRRVLLGRKRRAKEITFDEILLDSSNLPSFDHERFEGRVEMPISAGTVISVGATFIVVVMIFLSRAYDLQVVRGAEYAALSEENRLAHSVIFSERGVIYDRTGKELAWNEIASSTLMGMASSTATSSETTSSPLPHPLRRYSTFLGLSHVVGYVQYPKADASGTWWRTEFSGVAGAEKVFDARLAGTNGRALIEVDAKGRRRRQEMLVPPLAGQSVTLSVDAEVQSKLHEVLAKHAENNRFVGGASVIMDVHTGEVIAMVSVPEYNSSAMSDGDRAAIREFSQSTRKPFLNRAIAGAYTPGSIVKPLFAAAALQEGIISPEKQIFSPGYISIPNPYDPSNPTIVKDWRAHGWTDMRRAIAVSSDVYFFAIGGGYEDQKGLGITKLDTYARHFGLGTETGFDMPGEATGVIPTPEWKAEKFDGDEWRLGDTYNTSIGQYGFQVTPLQMVRAVAAIANGGDLLQPHIIASTTPVATPVGIDAKYLKIIREGMRQAAEPGGTAQALAGLSIQMGGKTGTAELGAHNEFMNSWVVGFWPYENPRYAFATVLEKAPAGTLSGASPGMYPFFQWLIAEKSEYTTDLTQ